MTAFQVYLLTRVPVIQEALCFFTVLLGIGLLILGMFWALSGSDRLFEKEHRMFSRVLKWLLPAFLLAGSGAILMPNRQDIATIFVGEYLTNSAEVAKLPDNVVKTINSWLEEAQTKSEVKK